MTPERTGSAPQHTHALAIWGYAFGYFLCYVPYSGLTKALSSGTLDGTRLSGLTLLASSLVGMLITQVAYLAATGWWRFAARPTRWGVSIPLPGVWTGLSGVASAAIIGTTTLAYTFEGASILLMMLLMRGGVLVVAPLVDALSGRKVRARAWVALLLSLLAVTTTGGHLTGSGLPLLALLDVLVYLGGYVVRLRLMSHQAKTDSREVSIRYFVEEQLVSVPLLAAVLVAVAFLGEGPRAQLLQVGFVGLFDRGSAWAELVVGALSQGTGLFGALILLDARESTFCVPVNRASSVLAGIVASVLLSLGFGMAGVSRGELLGAGIMVAAIAALSLPERRKAREAQPQGVHAPDRPLPGPGGGMEVAPLPVGPTRRRTP